MRILRYLAIFCVLVLVLPPPKASAGQAPLRGKLVVTVNDPSGAILPGATVTVAPQEGATQGTFVAPLTASPDGVVTIDGLLPGRYTIQATFPGFEVVQVRDFRVRAGENKRLVTLPLKRMAETVEVGRDKRSAALDPKGSAFSTILTREQIEALPDDPDEMEAVLKAMSPPGATLRVDGFTGGRLPPKSQIRSIRLPRMDQLAAQNHGGANGLLFIDILTQPGNGPLRGSVDGTFRDDALNAKNPFTPVKGLEQLHQAGFAMSGTVVPNRSSFSFNAQKARQLESGSLLAAIPTPGEPTDVAAPIIQPTDRSMFTARFDQATTKDRMIRASFTRSSSDRRNLGVGAYDLPERAYATNASDNVLRVSENGPVGRKLFSESRVQLHWSDAESTSSVESITTRVLDAFTNGGAQQAGGRRIRDFEAATDLDYVRGSHSYRVGVLLEGGSYRVNDNSNYLGTYTFASLDDYSAGRPSNFTRKVGDPDVRYRNLQFGAYVQDDYRIARSLLLSYGLRYEAQNLISDQQNWSPRGTVTWSPFRHGKTTVRGGWGFFTDWLGTSVYEQTLRLDGTRQREVNVQDPNYPLPDIVGTSPPANRYELGSGLILPESTFANAGLDQQLSSAFRVGATYTYRRGSRALRGLDLNAPVSGLRPDPAYANVVSVQDDGAAMTRMLNVNASYILLNWHQTFLAANYTLASSRTNTTGAFGLPASGRLDTEWGPTIPRHRVGASFNTQPIRNLGVALNLRAQSGSPYNITTGRDDNGDGLFTDRPAGVSRNAALGTTQWDVGARVSYAIGFGPQRTGSGGGGQPIVVNAGGGGGGGMPGGFGGQPDRRFRFEVYASAQNVTNHANYIGFSGVMTSPFFGEATNVLNPRKIEIGTRISF